MRPFSINIKGNLHSFTEPVVMGIINFTPDSFFEGSRVKDEDQVRRRVHTLLEEGAGMLDVGAYSTRPGASNISEEEELKRLSTCLEAVRKEAPDAIVSVDTFRARIARAAVTQMGADIINDISGGNADPMMLQTVADIRAPYILMHSRGTTPAEMQIPMDADNFIANVVGDLSEKLSQLKLLGVNDIIIDPGFGFSKTLDQNYQLLAALEYLDVFRLPILVGVSRKSMITKLLGLKSDEALNGTTSINTISLMHGASILRVHDAKAACQAVKIYTKTISSI